MQGRVTNGLRLGWATPLAYFEDRLATLRALEDSDCLHEFFVTETDTGAKVGDQHHELRIGSPGILAVLYPPEESGAAVVEAISEALDRLAPKRLRTLSVFTQYLHSVDLSYDDARGGLARRMVGSIATGPAADCAILFDTTWPRGTASVEFGVVNKSEMSTRLVGGVGRAHPPSAALRTRELPSELPAVALYVEANHEIAIPEKVDRLTDFVLESWADAADDSSRVAASLVEDVFAVSVSELGGEPTI